VRFLLLLFFLLSLTLVAPAQEARCDCDPALRHFCRCGILIEQDMADLQLNYLNRLLMAEFNDYLYRSPATTVRLAPAEEMVLGGEATQGYFDNTEIVINNSLTRDQALMVLAHELGHAWQFVAQPDPDAISSFLAEGFAEWVSYHMMKRAGLTEYCHRLKTNKDPLYGDSFRWYHQIEEQYGTDAVVKIMRTWLHQDGTQRGA
jgi:hypothetical protein